MATTSITSISTNSLRWQIMSLGNPFNTTYYMEAGIASASFTDGTSSRPSVIDSVAAPSSGTSYNAPSTSKLASGSWTPGRQYTSYGFARAANGNYYHAGSATYTMDIDAPTGLSSGTPTSSSIPISWNSVSGARHYLVRYRPSGGSYAYKMVYGTSTTLTGLSRATKYYIAVLASGYDANSSYSSEIVAYTFWEWTYAKTSGGYFNITGAEWLAFYNAIDLARVKNGLSAYAFTRTSSYFDTGDIFYYWMMTQPATAIDDINGLVSNEIKAVSSDDIIYAWYFNNMKTALNNALS